MKAQGSTFTFMHDLSQCRSKASSLSPRDEVGPFIHCLYFIHAQWKCTCHTGKIYGRVEVPGYWLLGKWTEWNIARTYKLTFRAEASIERNIYLIHPRMFTEWENFKRYHCNQWFNLILAIFLIAGLTISGVSLGLGSEMAFLDSGFKQSSDTNIKLTLALRTPQ